MEEKDLEILHKYMLRRIAEKNIVFSGMSYKFRETSKSMRTNIFRNFARGDMSYFSPTAGNINLDYINEDIYENGKSVSPYNYFDLDTLIAYDSYLERVIDEIYNSREKDGRRYFLLKDFTEVIDTKVPMFFKKNSGTKETGYYNLHRTIGTLKDKDNRITYKRTPDKKTFEKNYSKYECNQLLQEYLKEKHPEKIETGDDVDTSNDYIEIYGKKFYVTSTEVYLDANYSPIKYIVGVTEDNRTEIRGFLNLSGEIYYGDVYDTEGNYVYDRDQSGLAMFGEGATNKYNGRGRE